MAEGANEVWVSAATIWEIAIKRARGRLDSPADLRGRVAADGMLEMDVRGDHAIAAGALPRIHDDPFDRMLVAQAQIEGLTIVTRDPEIVRYDVPVLVA